MKTLLPQNKSLQVTIIIITFLLTLYIFGDIIMPFVIGGVISYLAYPISRYSKKLGIPTSISSFFAISICVVLVYMLWSIIVPLIVNQLIIAANNLQPVMQELSNNARHYFQSLDMQHQETLLDSASKALEIASQSLQYLMLGFLRTSFAITNIIAMIILAPIIAYYTLSDWNNIQQSFFRLFSKGTLLHIKSLMQEIDETLKSYLVGQIIVSFVLGSFYAVLLYIIGLESALSVGILIGVLVLVPYLGAIIAYIITALLVYVQMQSLTPIFIVSLGFAVAQTAESYILTPYFIGRRIGLHPNYLFLGIMFFGKILGLIGIIFALPLTALASIFIRFFMRVYSNS